MPRGASTEGTEFKVAELGDCEVDRKSEEEERVKQIRSANASV